MTRSYVTSSSLVELSRNTLGLFRRHYRGLVAIAAVILLLPYVGYDAAAFLLGPDSGVVILLGLFALLPMQLAANIALVGEVSDAAAGGDVSAVGGLARMTGRGMARLIGTWLIAWGLIVLVGIVAFVAVAVAYALSEEPLVLVILGVVAAVVFLRLIIRYSFVSQVVILERKYWVSALRRSGQLVKSAHWQVVGYWIGFYGPIYIVISLLLFGTELLEMTERSRLLLDNLTGSLFTVAIYSPLVATFQTLFYYRRRMDRGELSAADLVEIQSYSAP